MFTTFKLMLALFVSLFASLAAALPVSLEPRDVYVPPVLYPHAGTVWKVGAHHNVTWDVSDPPVNITNKFGMIVLAKNGIALDLDSPLAANFSILDGRHVIQVPKVTPASDYQILLFGDSGNLSPEFTITA
ncbi:hypothetical protein PUNSTDRAFT_49940 [Punctularia strigosozonata HHB-11173 SS5]|uniref:uncharacterized protein n=1 Tax=Punctularia strigosozonata (strain HHB-11173) TaxID=741275 RepID=UPI0004417076|nr:uncharacterized protein PUNSTDRAFT_49940 [Punctularia strigosozonata HHB-11173 SS5]EIN12651.1 hypothetical protein PUNSTDRAFT_49940 [Punctularia strigosozonata HHB-11173 SS5]